MINYKIRLYKALTFTHNQPPVELYYINVYDLNESGVEKLQGFKTPQKAISYFNKLFSFKLKLKDFTPQENYFIAYI